MLRKSRQWANIFLGGGGGIQYTRRHNWNNPLYIPPDYVQMAVQCRRIWDGERSLKPSPQKSICMAFSRNGSRTDTKDLLSVEIICLGFGWWPNSLSCDWQPLVPLKILVRCTIPCTCSDKRLRAWLNDFLPWSGHSLAVDSVDKRQCVQWMLLLRKVDLSVSLDCRPDPIKSFSEAH